MIDIYGNDIDKSWTFTNGDINIVKNVNNLGQAIYNRLRTDLGTFDMFYVKYGGNLYEELGEVNHPTIHEYIRIEIEHILEQEHRIQNIDCTVNKLDSNGVDVTLKVTPIRSTETLTYNLVIGNDSYVTITDNPNELTYDRS